MKLEIITRGPVAAVFEVYEDFAYYKGGVYIVRFLFFQSDSRYFSNIKVEWLLFLKKENLSRLHFQYTAGRMTGSHAVKNIGWGEEGDLPYWLVANSWNTEWGENGKCIFEKQIRSEFAVMVMVFLIIQAIFASFAVMTIVALNQKLSWEYPGCEIIPPSLSI